MTRRNLFKVTTPLNDDEVDLLRAWLIRVDGRQAVSVWTVRRLIATLDSALDRRWHTRRGA